MNSFYEKAKIHEKAENDPCYLPKTLHARGGRENRKMGMYGGHTWKRYKKRCVRHNHTQQKKQFPSRFLESSFFFWFSPGWCGDASEQIIIPVMSHTLELTSFLKLEDSRAMHMGV
jgi:hypothetical protein